jgi:hypothetical protein
MFLIAKNEVEKVKCGYVCCPPFYMLISREYRGILKGIFLLMGTERRKKREKKNSACNSIHLVNSLMPQTKQIQNIRQTLPIQPRRRLELHFALGAPGNTQPSLV